MPMYHWQIAFGMLWHMACQWISFHFMQAIVMIIMLMFIKWLNLLELMKYGNPQQYFFQKMIVWCFIWIWSDDSSVHYEQPCGPQHKWTKKQIMAWLRNCQLSTIGKHSEVSDRVVKYMTQICGTSSCTAAMWLLSAGCQAYYFIFACHDIISNAENYLKSTY